MRSGDPKRQFEMPERRRRDEIHEPLGGDLESAADRVSRLFVASELSLNLALEGKVEPGEEWLPRLLSRALAVA